MKEGKRIESDAEEELFGCLLEKRHLGRILHELEKCLKEKFSSQKEQQGQSPQDKSMSSLPATARKWSMS